MVGGQPKNSDWHKVGAILDTNKNGENIAIRTDENLPKFKQMTCKNSLLENS